MKTYAFLSLGIVLTTGIIAILISWSCKQFEDRYIQSDYSIIPKTSLNNCAHSVDIGSTRSEVSITTDISNVTAQLRHGLSARHKCAFYIAIIVGGEKDGMYMLITAAVNSPMYYDTALNIGHFFNTIDEVADFLLLTYHEGFVSVTYFDYFMEPDRYRKPSREDIGALRTRLEKTKIAVGF